MKIWKRLTQRGVNLFRDEVGQKMRRIQSTGALIGIFSGVAGFGGIAALKGFLDETVGAQLNQVSDVHPMITFYTLLTLIVIVFNFALYYALGKYVRPIFIGALHAIAMVGAMVLIGISTSKDTLAYLLLVAIVPIPFLMSIEKRDVIGLTPLPILGLIFCLWYHWKFDPIFPVQPWPTGQLSIDYDTFILVVNVCILSAVACSMVSFGYMSWRNTVVSQEFLQQERAKSDRLLLNILPDDIVRELKETGKAAPVRVEDATIVFTDFVGFTRIAEMFSPEEVVEELDLCFSYFDQVTEKYNLDKLKTIGDSFMCAGGLPVPNKTHAFDCCLAALEIQAFMNQMKEIKEQQGLDYWELRLGISTGPLVAGVVGEKKFAYDVWGDTVNTASRMESSGVSGKINLSQATYDAVKNLFVCEYRGKVQAKHKGEIDMYFLTGIKAEFSVNGEGRVPNEGFRLALESL